MESQPSSIDELVPSGKEDRAEGFGCEQKHDYGLLILNREILQYISEPYYYTAGKCASN